MRRSGLRGEWFVTAGSSAWKVLAQAAGRDVGDDARAQATRESAERIAGHLSPEQDRALRIVTGPERVAVLVGPAGTGKGVVIDTAARAEQLAGRDTIGVAVSGSTAEGLGADSPALAERTLTLNALVARANIGTVPVGRNTTVFFDEAGMADHKRLDALTELVEHAGAKLIAVGDGKQLPSIGPGGMFDRIADHAPVAALADIHRTHDPHERKAWAALRAGEPERAMAHYQARGQLYFADTREEAGEAAVQRWASLTEHHDIRQVALIADASNQEIDRLNARAQHLRVERGELGPREIPLPHLHYGLREGDLIAFTAQHRPPGQARVENGARGQVTHINEHGGLTLTLDGSGRQVGLAGKGSGVSAPRLCPARLSPARRHRRALRCSHRRLADQQGDSLCRGQPRPSGHRVVSRPRRARCRGPGRATRHATRAQDAPKPRPDTLARTPELPDPGWGRGFDLGRMRPPSLARWLTRTTRNLNRAPERDAARGGR
jgi:hypothetical protein